ncbi:arginyltransferase [Allofranklinella schreckenbergeri]|uniref:Aspartate/glutamate leucyltransferase n=1 Tax=Allofranklinella schreckenbergeri TaxID=1076744 RepID=A0A3M6QW56_9BURK|nr:arginyltransferase [Allofranklinella schreckenbergeri]RMX07234.1 arginyltransferase [Allofranklinella schreckenbergeri]
MTTRSFLPLSVTAPYPCSYLPGATARSLLVTPGDVVDTQVYSALVDKGFRRSGLFTYRPLCQGCNACQTLRLPVQSFAPNRSQRRTWRQHQALTVHIAAPRMQAEHYALYQRYLKARHSGGGMESDSASDYEQLLLRSRVNTQLVEFWAASEQGEAQLRMVSVVDVLQQGLSAVYTFYDDAINGLGTFGILWLVHWARQLGLAHVYLGYWIEGCAKMAYKTRFLPCEILQDGRWVRLERTGA